VRTARRLALWALALGAAALLTAGRYDWARDGRLALAGFLSTMYFTLIVAPTAWGLLSWLGVGTRARAIAVSAILVVASLPYRWLGLGGLRVLWRYAPGPKDPPVFLPQALTAPMTAPEIALFVALALVGAAIVCWRWRGVARRWGLALVAVILLQTALHTSTRSPYTWIPFVESLGDRGKWYRLDLLPDGHGAVNADAPLFTVLDEHFKATRPVNPYLLRRSFPHWLGAHATYFVNPYFVYLVINVALWIAAVCAAFGWARRLSGDEHAARLTAALVAVANGFIIYVAQPMSYVAANAAVVIALWAFEAFAVSDGERRREPLLLGAVLGLCALTYDLFPFTLALVGYGWLRRVRWRITVTALAIGYALYGGWQTLQHSVLGIRADATNFVHATDALKGLKALVHQPFGTMLAKVGRVFVVFAVDHFWAFACVGLVLGAGGLAIAARGRVRWALVVLTIPSLMTIALMELGNTRWGKIGFGELPRLAYVSWPAMLLGTALLLVRARDALGRWQRVAAALPWVVVAAIFVLHNADVFGVVGVHYHFFWPTPVGVNPYGR
jgi:hypothetical protein